MHKLLLATALALICTPAMAWVSIGYEQITPTTATGLTVPSGAAEALVVCDQPVMWRDDGTNPTSSVGMLLPAQTALPYTASLARLKFIKVSATAICGATYFQ